MKAIAAVIGGGFALAGIAAAMVIYSAFAWGFALEQTWAMLALPLFPSAPSLSFAEAVAVVMVGRAIRPATTHPSKGDDKAAATFVGFILGPWISIGAAWLVAAVLL